MRKIKLLSIDQLKALALNSVSAAEVCRKLGYADTSGTTTRLRRKLLVLGIDISHWTGQSWSKGKTVLEDGRLRPARSSAEIFSTSSNASPHYARKLILNRKLLSYNCSICLMPPIWRDKPITLQLDHINGNRTDQRLENLRWLCPNCHCQTDTYGGKNNKKAKSPTPDDVLISALKTTSNIWQALKLADLANGRNYSRAKKLIKEHSIDQLVPAPLTKKACIDCQAEIHNNSIRCVSCNSTANNKIVWPTNEDLSKLVWSVPSSKLAIQLGVSDKAIEKRCKRLHLAKPPRGYWAKISKNIDHDGTPTRG